MKRLAVLLVAGCSEILEPRPRPPEPAPTPVAPCTGEHVQVAGAWTLELHDPMPALSQDHLVYRRGASWVVAPIAEIPGAPNNRFDFDNLYDARVDRDGTVYFRGLWYGNPDQVNNVGDGLYRLDGKRATPLVDPSTLLPGSTKHFNSAGGFSADQGWVAFWGGRPNELGGVYVWHDGKVFAIADTTMAVRGTGTPSVHAGQIAFQGEESGARGVYLWSEGTGTKRILRSSSGIFANVALGDNVVYAGAFEPRRIVAWSAGTEWVAATAAWFAGRVGDQPILEADPVARGDDLAVNVAQGQRSEVWNVSGCTLERVAGSGDRVAGQTIDHVGLVQTDAGLAGDLVFLVELAGGSRRLARAHRAVHAT